MKKIFTLGYQTSSVLQRKVDSLTVCTNSSSLQ